MECNFPAQLDILRYRKTWNQHEFLVHHADAQLHSHTRIIDFNRFSIKFDGSAVSTSTVDHRHTKQNVHQSGFAGAIFTHQRVDFTRSDFQLDTLQYLVAKILFGDVLHFQYIFVIHSLSPL